MWPNGSHSCIILQVCIHLVLERLCWTELMDAQLTVLIVLVDDEYLFIIYIVSAGVWCASFFVVCRDPRLSDLEHCARAIVWRGKYSLLNGGRCCPQCNSSLLSGYPIVCDVYLYFDG